MKITYIYHSCFVAENDDVVLVYDYWRDNEAATLAHILEGVGERQLYFIVSHFHEDHFNASIVDYEGARLLVSYDAAKRRRLPKERLSAVLRPADIYEDEHLKVHAMRSTDVGISTLTTMPDGTTIYHAGDNNNWYFVENEGEHIRCTLDEMEGMFLSNLREVRSVSKAVDYLMFPVDPRLEGEMLRGVCQCLQHLKVKHFYPMHTWERWDEVRRGVEQLKELFPETVFVMPEILG